MTFYKPILLAVLIFTCCCVGNTQTISDVHVAPSGRKKPGVNISFIINNIRLNLDDRGNVQCNMAWDGNKEIDVEYYNNVISYQAGKLKSINALDFEYYNDVISYQAGKLKSINNLELDYYNDFSSYEAGKLKTFGDIHLEYYNDFSPEKAGRLKSVSNAAGSIELDYFNSFYPEKTGRLQSVKGKIPGVTLDICL